MKRPLRYGSVCSGIEAATAAWHPLGWVPQWFAEIAAFPSAVLAHRWPDVPNIGDFTRAQKLAPIDLLVGGTPCQSFSIAGLGEGMADDRGKLSLQFCRLAERTRPRWVVWENVPGVLSNDGGRAFGSIVGALAKLGYGWAYRVLDAQHFGVPQRRRRVFLVGCLGDWRAPAAVLFERSSLRWDPPPRRTQGASVAGSLGGGPQARGWNDDLDRSGAFVPVAPTLQSGGRTAGSATTQDAENGALIIAQCHGGSVGPMGTLRSGDNMTSGVPFIARAVSTRGGARHDPNGETYVTHSLRGGGFDASEDGTGRGVPLVACFDETQITSRENRSKARPESASLSASASARPPTIAMAVAVRGREGGQSIELGGEQSNALRANGGGASRALAFHTLQDPISGEVSPVLDRKQAGMGVMPCEGLVRRLTPREGLVRRLTPRECERLQGFPDDYTLVKLTKKQRSKVDAEMVDYHVRQGHTLGEAEDFVRNSPDGPRYQAIGNSMAVPVMRWLGERIAMVEALR